MGNRLYIGNLPYSISDSEVRAEFEKCGTVTDLKLITDRETGRPKGFGFVEFASDAEANAAIQALNGSTLGGRAIIVNIAEKRQGGGGRSFGGGGGPRPYSPPPQDDRGRGRGKRGGGSRRRRDDSDWG